MENRPIVPAVGVHGKFAGVRQRGRLQTAGELAGCRLRRALVGVVLFSEPDGIARFRSPDGAPLLHVMLRALAAGLIATAEDWIFDSDAVRQGWRGCHARIRA